MKTSPKRWTRSRLVILFALAVCAAVLYDRAVRRVALGREFQYLPRESEMVIATGDITSLWSAADDLFQVSSHTDWAAELATESEKLKLPVKQLSDLQKYGLDLHRGLLLSVYRPTSDADVTAVIPIVDRSAFFRALTQLEKGLPQETSVLTGPREKIQVYQFKDFCAAFPEPDLAVISSSYDLIRRSITLPSENLFHAANNDSLYEAIRHVLRRPLLTGPNIFCFWQSRTAPFNNRAAVVRLQKEELAVEGEFELNGGTLRVVDDLRRRSERSSDWAAKLPAKAFATAVLQDKSLPHYRNFVAEEVLGDLFPELANQIKRWTPDRENLAVTRIAASITDIRDDLPDFVVGVWGNKQQLAHLLEAAQQDLRRTRDLALLNGAISKYRQSENSSPSVGELERLRFLSREDYSLFDRYQIASDGSIPAARYQPKDFDSPAYKRSIDGHTVTFLAPPLGDNDLAYRPELKGADPRALRSDRYRIATVFDGDVLWIATEPSDLQAVFDRTAQKSHDSLAGKDAGKLHVTVDVGKLVAMAPTFFSGTARKDGPNAFHLPDFSTLTLDASPSFDETRLRFSAKLKRRPSL